MDTAKKIFSLYTKINVKEFLIAIKYNINQRLPFSDTSKSE